MSRPSPEGRRLSVHPLLYALAAAVGLWAALLVIVLWLTHS